MLDSFCLYLQLCYVFFNNESQLIIISYWIKGVVVKNYIALNHCTFLLCYIRFFSTSLELNCALHVFMKLMRGIWAIVSAVANSVHMYCTCVMFRWFCRQTVICGQNRDPACVMSSTQLDTRSHVLLATLLHWKTKPLLIPCSENRNFHVFLRLTWVRREVLTKLYLILLFSSTVVTSTLQQVHVLDESTLMKR